MKKPVFENGGMYHVYNRGVEKRNTFLDDHDYFRFLHGLYEFNDKHPASRFSEVEPPNYRKEFVIKNREVIVEVLAYCLMPNHFHLLIRQITEEGIVRFMQKLGTGYTNCFNKKYDRVGHLFQGRFKAVRITQESHMLHIPYYIHANPLDLFVPRWRTEGVADARKAREFLKQYAYSSFRDYSRGADSLILDKKFLTDILGNPHAQEEGMFAWLRERKFDDIDALTLE
jgi:putative transposase